VDAAQREEVLARYRARSRHSEAAAGTVPEQEAPAPASAVGGTAKAELAPTARELEVLALVSEGFVNREIGTRLGLSEETVKSHMGRVLTKLHARSRAHAVAIAFRRSLLR
jgi:DNA-binding NarL/FixJ family response regulator